MGAVDELPVPKTGAVTDLQVPDTGETVTPQQADVRAFHATAGDFRKGLRSSVNSLGAAMHGLLAGTGQAMGLTQYADERFHEADEYAKFADAVGPRIRDYRAVRDLQDIVDFTVGLAGEGAGALAPMAVGGVAGGLRGAAAATALPEMGQQLLRTKDANASPQRKLGVAAAEAAVSTAGGLAVPLAAAKRVGQAAKGIATGPGAVESTLTATAGQGAVSGVQERARQAAHTIVDPNRKIDQEEEEAAVINATIGGAVAGAPLGAAPALASKAAEPLAAARKRLAGKLPEAQALPTDRPQTVDEAKSALDKRERPARMDPDLESMPDDADGIGRALDEHDAKVDQELARKFDKNPEKYEKFDGWAADPEKRDAFHEAISAEHVDEVDRPRASKLLEGLKDFVGKLGKPGEKRSERRTALDLAIHDEVVKRVPEETLAAMTPKQRLELSDVLKQYALHTAGRKEELPGPGAPEKRFDMTNARLGDEGQPSRQVEGQRPAARRVPHELMDIFGDRLHEVVDRVQKLLGRGGIPLEKPVTKKELTDAGKRRGARQTALEEVVLSHLRDEHQADKATRNEVVGEMTRRLQEAVTGGVDDWARFERELDYAFGGNKEAVLEAFDRERDNITRRYEDLGEMEPRTDESVAERLRRNEHFRVTEEDEGAGALPVTEAEASPTGEQASRAEEAHPYRDKRLGVPIEEKDLFHTIDALRSEYDQRSVKFRAEPEIDKDGNMTGRHVLHAEDAEAPVGFSKDELSRIQEQQGRAGLDNSVVTVVRKDPDNAERNKTIAISIPNLVAETIRVTRRRGDGPGYVRDMVMEGLGRLASDPEFVRFAPSSEKTGWSFPDDMYVITVNGRDYQWKDVKRSGLSSRALQMQRFSSDMVERARHEDRLLTPLSEDASKTRGDALVDQMERNRALVDDDRMKSRIDDAIEQVREEIARRKRDGDAATYDANRELGVVSTEEIMQRNQGREGPRHYQEETGLALGSEPLKSKPGALPRGELSDEAKVRLKEERKAAEYREMTEGGTEAEKEARKASRKNAELDPKKKLSEMRMGRERITPEQEAQVRAEVEKLLGPHATVLFRDMETAGQYGKVSGAEMLAVSIRSLDPLGVGRHESTHALIERLRDANPRAHNVLLNAARSPTVVAQLHRILKDEPAALRQLKDPEERAAYMSEFWAAGELKVGPDTAEALGQLKAMLKSGAHALLGIGEDVGTLQQADALLAAFHSGELAEPSAAARALSRLLPRDELHSKWMERFGDWANRVLSTATSYIHDQKIPAFNEIADKMDNRGEGGGGLVQTRHTTRNQFMNRYAVATKGLDDAALGRVLEALQGNGRTQGAAEGAAVRAIRGLLDDLYGYMQEKGVKVVEWSEEGHAYVEHDLQRVPDFFPRAYSREAIEANWQGFVDLLRRHEVPNPESVAQQLVTPTKAAPGESDHTAGLTYYAPNTMARKLRIPDAELAPFMKKDLGSIMYDYVNYTTRRGEYAARFGNQGQEIASAIKTAEQQGATPEQLRSFSKYVQSMEGSLGNEIDPKLRKFFGAVLTYQNFRLLPLALFSSLIDPLGIWARGGTAGEAMGAFTRGVRELVSVKEDDARQLARVVGAINEATEEHMVSEMYGQNYGANWQKWLNDKLFRLNGMESWNNSMRTAAVAAAQEFIVRHAERPGEHSERWLRELGIARDDVRTVGGKLDLTPAVTDAINKWVDGAVLRPHAGIRPMWMSDPHFMLVAHLKQFTYSFQKTINERVAHEALHGNYTPLMVLMSYVPGIIAADILRAAITPGGKDDDRLNKWGAWDWLKHGASRAGLTGPGQYALDGFTDLQKGRLGIESLGGPTIEQISNLMHAAAGNGDMAREGLRALPLVPALGMR